LLAIHDETPTLRSVSFDIDGFDFTPGQSLMLDWGTGPVEAPISSDSMFLPHVRVTLPSDVLPPDLEIHRMVGVAGPCGSDWPVMDLLGNDVLMVGLEIGIATLLPLVSELVRVRESVGRLTLVIGVGRGGVVPFHRELLELAADDGVHLLLADDTCSDDGGLAELAEESLVMSGRSASACVAAPTRVAAEIVDRLHARGLGRDLMHVASACHWKCENGECGRCRHGPNEVDRVGAIARADHWRPATIPRVLPTRRDAVRA
jgi:NAD(P)H-flavin reductase